MESVDDDDVDKVERARRGAWKAAADAITNKKKIEMRVIIVSILIVLPIDAFSRA
jgi:hypothetical protein